MGEERTDNQLSLRCAIQEDESIHGLIVRVAEALGSTPASIASHVGMRFPLSPGSSQEWIAPLSALTGVPQAELRRRAYILTNDQHVTIEGVPFPANGIATGNPRVCPPCLADARYHRFSWELLSMQVCPVHACELATHCPRCGSRFSWKTTSLFRCSCGVDLREIVPEPVSERDLIASREVGMRLGLVRDATKMPKQFADMSLPELLETFAVFGRIAIAGKTGKAYSGATIKRSDAHRILSMGADMCVGWPQTFYEALDQRFSHPANANATGAKRAFGSIYISVSRGGGGGCRPLLRDALAEYLRQRPSLPVGLPGRFYGADPRHADFVDLMEVERLLGMTRRQINRLRTRWVRRVRTKDYGTKTLYCRKDVEELADMIKRAVSLSDMAELLGVDRRRANAIVRCGRFEILDVPVRGKRAVAVDPADVFDFLHQLQTAAAGRPKAVSPMTFRSLVASAAGRGIEMSVLMSLLGSGKLVACAVSSEERGFDSLVFERDEVIAAFSEWHTSATDTLSVPEVARELKLVIPQASDLVRMGLLMKAPDSTGLPKGVRIPVSEVDEFRLNYATGRDLARLLGYVQRPKHWQPVHHPDFKLVAQVGPHHPLDIYRRVGPGNCPSAEPLTDAEAA